MITSSSSLVSRESSVSPATDLSVRDLARELAMARPHAAALCASRCAAPGGGATNLGGAWSTIPSARPSVPSSGLPATIQSLSRRAPLRYLNMARRSGGTFCFLNGSVYRCTILPVAPSRRTWRTSSEWRPSSQRYRCSKARRCCAWTDSTIQSPALRACALCTSQIAHVVALTS